MSLSDDPVLQREVARELCNTRIAQCSARLGEEEARPVPDAALIAAIREECQAIVLERQKLLGASAATVAAAIRWSRVALAQQRARYWGDGA